MSLRSILVAKDHILNKVFTVFASHPILYPEKGSVRFLFASWKIDGRQSICDDRRLGAVSLLLKGWGRQACWLIPRKGKPICICTLDTVSETRSMAQCF